jgi:predicted nuclease of predicted toxin-antitoxin system
MPLSPRLAEWLNQQGHDAVHAADLGLDHAPDSEILERARTDRQVVVTADLDYPRLLAMAQAEGPGVILFRGGNYSEREIIQRLQDAFQTVPLEELPVVLLVVERSRIRRRRLPVGP